VTAEPRRRPLVSANWKMHHDHLQAIRTVGDLGLRLAATDVGPLDVSVHPPFTDLRSVQTVIEDRAIPVALGAQHCFSEDQGAFTGEVAPPMLARLGVSYVIVGHSERRQLFGMTDEQVAATLRAVLRHGMTPILCVGETAEERQAGSTEARLTEQLIAALEGLKEADVAGMVIAYEPIWAIGTGVNATGRESSAACGHIREVVSTTVGPEGGRGVRIQYGGSVRPDNTADMMGQADIDGLLVGGASLDAPTFVAIVREAGANRR
jgi:triosephosphate isomerase (TIM)